MGGKGNVGLIYIVVILWRWAMFTEMGSTAIGKFPRARGRKALANRQGWVTENEVTWCLALNCRRAKKRKTAGKRKERRGKKEKKRKELGRGIFWIRLSFSSTFHVFGSSSLFFLLSLFFFSFSFLFLFCFDTRVISPQKITCLRCTGVPSADKAVSYEAKQWVSQVIWLEQVIYFLSIF